MKVENNNKIISIGILLIGISLFYYFIIVLYNLIPVLL
jgi:hypothetical protein